MTIPFYCLIIAVILPYICAGISAYFRTKLPGGLDNKNPRQQVSELAGPGARAAAAQNNAWEALAVFTAAVMVAHLAGADPQKSALAAEIFIVARIAHLGAYIANIDVLRSLVFSVGYFACLYLFYLGAVAV